MLALERHIRVPFDTQNRDEDFSKYDDARSITQRLCDLSNQHVDTLKTTLDGLGGHEASPIKSAIVEMEGAVAGAIDKMRKTKVSKALRDDYTALALCCAGYSALIATSNAMGDSAVAAVAQSALQDYAQVVMDIGQALPSVVVQELRDTDLSVDESTIGTSQDAVGRAWQSASSGSRGGSATRGSIDSPYATPTSSIGPS